MTDPDLEPAVTGPVLDPDDKRAALKRAARTFLQGLAVDVVVALGLLLLPVFTKASAFSDLDGQIILFSVTKTVVVTLLSFAMRYFKVVPKTL